MFSGCPIPINMAKYTEYNQPHRHENMYISETPFFSFTFPSSYLLYNAQPHLVFLNDISYSYTQNNHSCIDYLSHYYFYHFRQVLREPLATVFKCV